MKLPHHTSSRIERVCEAAQSFDDIAEAVRAAIIGQLIASGQIRPDDWCCIKAIYPDRAVIETPGDKMWSYGYSIDDQGAVTLSAPTAVEVAYQPVAVADAMEQSGMLVEAVAGVDGALPSRFSVRIIRAGLSGNNTYYSDQMLREGASLFNNARVFVRSDQDHIQGGTKDVGTLIGKITEAKFEPGPTQDTGALTGVLVAFDPDWRARLTEALGTGCGDVFGMSISALARIRSGTVGGRTIRVAEAFTRINSVDVICEPGADGRVLAVIEAVQEEPQVKLEDIIALIRAKKPLLLQGRDIAAITEAQAMELLTEALSGSPSQAVVTSTAEPAATATATLIAEAIRKVEIRSLARERVQASSLPQAAKARLIAEFEASELLTEAAIDQRITDEIAYLAPFSGGQVQGNGSIPRITMGQSRAEKVQEALNAFFDPTHKDHQHAQSIRALYTDITGDHRITGQLAECDQSLLTESLGSASFANVLGDGIRRAMVREYALQADVQQWREIVDIVPLADFRNREVVRFGGYSDLPIVNEGQSYVELASPSDEKAVYKAAKRGGTEQITMEMIRNDDVGVVRRIPVRMARSAARTLFKFVFDFYRNNPTVYDGLTFFHATHNNLGTAALDATSFAAGRLAFVKQTEYGLGAETLGVNPAYLLVPWDLQETAFNLFVRGTNNDQTFVQSLNPKIIPVFYWTDTNDWCLTARPIDIPSIEVGFLDGRQDPDVFVMDRPDEGSMFSNDAVNYKIRHIYGGAVIDYRGARKNVVP